MTAEQFEAEYAERSGLTLAELRAVRTVRPCTCDAEGCQGWQMMSYGRAAQYDAAPEEEKHLV